MCGRYTLAAPADELIETFDVGSLTFEYRPRWNIAPGQDAPIVAEDRRGRRIGLVRWGLIPAWKDVPVGGMINARSESVARRPSFREAFRRRRCLVPADGFYEWRREEGVGKQPYWIHPAAGGLMTFAGLWERWARPGEEPRHTFAILTTDATEEVRGVHDRIPVVVSAADRDAWLDRSSGPERLADILRPPADGTFALRAVSTRVNRPENDDEELIAPLGPEA